MQLGLDNSELIHSQINQGYQKKFVEFLKFKYIVSAVSKVVSIWALNTVTGFYPLHWPERHFKIVGGGK